MLLKKSHVISHSASMTVYLSKRQHAASIEDSSGRRCQRKQPPCKQQPCKQLPCPRWVVPGARKLTLLVVVSFAAALVVPGEASHLRVPMLWTCSYLRHAHAKVTSCDRRLKENVSTAADVQTYFLRRNRFRTHEVQRAIYMWHHAL